MESNSINFLLKDLKKLDHDELFEKTKELYYENQSQANKILNLEDEIIRLTKKIDKQKSKENKIISYDGFKTDWTMSQKIVFVLQKNKRPLSTKEIIGFLIQLQPNLADTYTNINKTLSNYIQNAFKLGFIIKDVKSFAKGYKYSLNK